MIHIHLKTDSFKATENVTLRFEKSCLNLLEYPICRLFETTVKWSTKIFVRWRKEEVFA